MPSLVMMRVAQGAAGLESQDQASREPDRGPSLQHPNPNREPPLHLPSLPITPLTTPTPDRLLRQKLNHHPSLRPARAGNAVQAPHDRAAIHRVPLHAGPADAEVESPEGIRGAAEERQAGAHRRERCCRCVRDWGCGRRGHGRAR